MLMMTADPCDTDCKTMYDCKSHSLWHDQAKMLRDQQLLRICSRLLKLAILIIIIELADAELRPQSAKNHMADRRRPQ